MKRKDKYNYQFNWESINDVIYYMEWKLEEIYGLVYSGLGSDAVKKYSRDDLLEKLEIWSNKMLEEEK